MHFTTFLSTTASLALTANAFLIPQEIAEDVQAAKAKAAEVVPSLFNHNSQSLDLDCSSCPFALTTERHGAREWKNGIESDLHMRFAAEQKHLTLNGEPFYPVTIQDLPGALHAAQTKKGRDEGVDVKLSYTLEMEHEKAADGNELVTVTMSVLGIENQMINVDNIEIKTIKEADGSVGLPWFTYSIDHTNFAIIIQLSLVSITPIPASPSDPDANCTNMMCRVVAKLGSAIRKAKAKAASAAAATAATANKVKCFCMRCFHRLAGHTAAVPGEGQSTHLPTHIVTRPGHFGAGHSESDMHHGHGHHKGFLHSVLGFARHLFTFIILPVMVGVAVGITASAIGMCVGQAVVFLWMRYRRSDNRQQGVYECVESEDKEEGLPPYDPACLPAYVYTDEEKEEADEKA